MEEVRAMFAYLALAPTGHPHDQMVAYLASVLRGYNPHWSASSLEAMRQSSKVTLGPTEYQASDRGSPIDIQKSPVIIPLTCEATGLYITAFIDGHPMKLLLDTGAGESITLTPQAARRLLLLRLGTSTISGTQGSEQSTDYVAKNLQLGRLRWSSVPIRTVDVGSSDGILGVGFLGHYVVSLDLAHQVIRLTASAEAPLAGTSRQSLHFHEYQQGVMFPAQVGGQDVWAELDTGSASTTASKRIAEALAENLPAGAVERAVSTDKSGIGKTSTKISRLRLDHPFDMVWGRKPLQVGLTVPELEGGSFLDDEISPRLDFEVGMLVGVSSLRAFQQVIIDYKHQSLFFDRHIEDMRVSPVTVTTPP